MNHAELIERTSKWALSNSAKGPHGLTPPTPTPYRCSFVVRELVTFSPEIPDVFGYSLSRRYSILFEIKVSRADFLKDQEKPFRKEPEIGMGNYRFYVCPEGLLEVGEIPNAWGLIVASPKGLKVVKHPISFEGPWVSYHNEPLLVSVIRRVHVRGDLDKIYDRKTIKRGN